ncbi:hypothetical protein B7P43_G06691 [Cryptotermes secundus]|uniref:Uncharacterized protein n=1 Tax=Cryptotermes secundus TaxID=105785 RepID=A0A2J7Q3I1_9NEOP|nr:hypothetical protein B7P43_G06691 [Cryptotermes secundus]
MEKGRSQERKMQREKVTKEEIKEGNKEGKIGRNRHKSNKVTKEEKSHKERERNEGSSSTRIFVALFGRFD